MTELFQDILLFDGAAGTYLSELYETGPEKCETANLTHPERVYAMHTKYIEAGAQAIKTNTFGANPGALGVPMDEVRGIIAAGVALARRASEDAAVKTGKAAALVFADIGPVQPEAGAAECDAETIYRTIADMYIDAGLRHFLLETFAEPESPLCAAAYIRSRVPDAVIIVQFAIAPDGYTAAGIPGTLLLERAGRCAAVDACGFNCMSGPHHLYRYIKSLPALPAKPLVVMPNAGYPAVAGSRTVFDASAGYFADRLAALAALGVRVLGGCCGTTPAHIRAAAARLHEQPLPQISLEDAARGTAFAPKADENPFYEKLRTGKKVIAVEFDPPHDVDIAGFMKGAARLTEGGVDLITLADCPVGRVRVDSSLLAAKLHRELGVDVMPHMTCRDRNINATKALLMGLHIEGVRNVLAITGDPIPQADRSEVKTVFNFNSLLFASFIRSLNETLFTGAPFMIGSALNVNVHGFHAELRRAKKKEASGTHVFFTQPVYTEQAVENVRLAAAELESPVLAGIMPLVSHKNALYIANEMSGISVPAELVARFEGTSREEASRIGFDAAMDAARAVAPYAAGFYLITPFRRAEMMISLAQKIRRELF